MKLLLENWREYIKEVEALDDIATTPEQIQQSIDWFYTSPDFDRGEKKGEESWEDHTNPYPYWDIGGGGGYWGIGGEGWGVSRHSFIPLRGTY